MRNCGLPGAHTAAVEASSHGSAHAACHWRRGAGGPVVVELPPEDGSRQPAAVEKTSRGCAAAVGGRGRLLLPLLVPSSAAAAVALKAEMPKRGYEADGVGGGDDAGGSGGGTGGGGRGGVGAAGGGGAGSSDHSCV